MKTDKKKENQENHVTSWTLIENDKCRSMTQFKCCSKTQR